MGAKVKQMGKSRWSEIGSGIIAFYSFLQLSSANRWLARRFRDRPLRGLPLRRPSLDGIVSSESAALDVSPVASRARECMDGTVDYSAAAVPALGALKRTADLLLGSLLFVALLPLMLAIAIAIRLDTPGPMLFRQNRRGLNGSVFQIFKFRTMFVESGDPDARVQSSRNDARVTRVGAFLRRRSLDELPQICNVVRGDMSLIGPRPHPLGCRINDGRAPSEVTPDYMARCRVRPGISGLAQVNGCRGPLRTAEQVEARVRHDLFYIENWSFMLDVKIIVRSLACLGGDPDAF